MGAVLTPLSPTAPPLPIQGAFPSPVPWLRPALRCVPSRFIGGLGPWGRAWGKQGGREQCCVPGGPGLRWGGSQLTSRAAPGSTCR